MECSVKRRLSNILLVICVIAGLGFLLYPVVSDWWNKDRQSLAEVDYHDDVQALDDKQRKEMWKQAGEYNSVLAKAAFGEMTADELPPYDETLKVTDEGTMSVIWIPKLSMRSPVRHGTDDGMLQNYIGHLPSSSLPVGGEDTHAVLVGHRGLPSAKLFTDLDLMEVGDVFVVETLGEKLGYRVENIQTVLPNEMDALKIQRGRDLCTLVTCTPYGVNSHRLLVTGARTELDDEEMVELENIDAGNIEPIYIMLALAAVVVLVLAILAAPRRRNKEEEEEAEETADA